MNKNKVDDILAGEMKKLGAAAGGVGGLAAGVVGSVAGAIGGGAGAAWVQQYLPTETCQEKACAPIDVETFLKTVYDVLDRTGKINMEFSAENSNPSVAAVVGSGFLNLNPTIVLCEVLHIEENKTIFQLTACAREGLINQKSAPKAVKRIMILMEEKTGGLDKNIDFQDSQGSGDGL